MAGKEQTTQHKHEENFVLRTLRSMTKSLEQHPWIVRTITFLAVAFLGLSVLSSI